MVSLSGAPGHFTWPCGLPSAKVAISLSPGGPGQRPFHMAMGCPPTGLVSPSLSAAPGHFTWPCATFRQGCNVSLSPRLPAISHGHGLPSAKVAMSLSLRGSRPFHIAMGCPPTRSVSSFPPGLPAISHSQGLPPSHSPSHSPCFMRPRQSLETGATTVASTPDVRHPPNPQSRSTALARHDPYLIPTHPCPHFLSHMLAPASFPFSS